MPMTVSPASNTSGSRIVSCLIFGNWLASFPLGLLLDKTRLIEFGRFAADGHRKRDEGKPETFDFLGFTHFCDCTKDKRLLCYRTADKRDGMLAKLRQIKDDLRARMNKSIDDNGRSLGAVLRGHYAYLPDSR
jgi:RNA-directed DNA polymerase